MSDGTRTRDFLDHNQVLYQLSYTHHERRFFRLERRRLEKCTGCRGVLAPAYCGAGPAAPPGVPAGAAGAAGAAGSTCLAAMARAVSVSGPGAGTKTASR